MTRPVAVILLAAAWPLAAHGQGSSFTGRVLTDSGVAITGAEVVLPALQRSQRTSEKGEFAFSAIPAGEHVVGVRMPGFAPRVDTIEVADAGEVRLDFKLARIEASLPEVSVTTSLLDRKLVEFHERRRVGIGRFLDSAEFASAHGTRTSDRLKKLPGLMIGRGRFLNDAYVLSTRGGGCRAAIWLDGVRLNDFSVNQLEPTTIAAVEWYAGPSSVPAKFNVTSAVCGVLVIWTR